MNKIFLTIGIICILNSCATVNNTPTKPKEPIAITTPVKPIINTPNLPQEESKPVQIIGGLSAPIYFQKYDQKMIDDIANVKTAKKIVISYPTNLKALALQIEDGIAAQSQTSIQLYEVNLQDTATVKYRHNVVIVALDFRDE